MLIFLITESASNVAPVKSTVPYEAVSPCFSLFSSMKHSWAKFAAVAGVSAAWWASSQPFQRHWQYLQVRTLQLCRIQVHVHVVCVHCQSTLNDFNQRSNCASLCENFISHNLDLPTFFLVIIHKSREYRHKHCWLSHLPVHVYFSRKGDPVSSPFREEEKDFRDLGPEWAIKREYTMHLTSITHTLGY